MSTRSIPYNPVIFKIAVLLIVVVPLLATILAIRLLWERAVHWPELALLGILYTLTTIGVCVGYHRMLAHRSFQAHPVVKFVLLVLGSMARQGNSVEWAAT